MFLELNPSLVSICTIIGMILSIGIGWGKLKNLSEIFEKDNKKNSEQIHHMDKTLAKHTEKLVALDDKIDDVKKSVERIFDIVNERKVK
jgi:esterase/lipase